MTTQLWNLWVVQTSHNTNRGSGQIFLCWILVKKTRNYWISKKTSENYTKNDCIFLLEMIIIAFKDKKKQFAFFFVYLMFFPLLWPRYSYFIRCVIRKECGGGTFFIGFLWPFLMAFTPGRGWRLDHWECCVNDIEKTKEEFSFNEVWKCEWFFSK